MKIFFSVAVAFFLSFSLLIAVSADESGKPPSKPSIQTEESQEMSEEEMPLIRPRSGVSWREKVMNKRYISYRGSDRRKALKREAVTEKPEQMEDMSIQSYNATIRKNSAKAWKEGQIGDDGNQSLKW